MAEAKDVAVIDDSVEEAVTASGSTDVVAIIQGMNNPAAGFYSSIKSDDFASRMNVARALTTSEPLDENLGKTINLVDFIIQPVDLANQQTGEVQTAPRVVLIGDDGQAYHATSIGLLSSLRNIVTALGEPSTWPQPVGISVVKQKGNNGYSFFTVKFV